jgi:dipeptidyl-peptidase 4
MIRIITLIAIPILLIQTALGQTGKKNITLEDLWKTGTFKIKNVPGFSALKDGRSYSKKEDSGTHQRISIFEIETGIKRRTLFDNTINKFEGREISVDDYTFSDDETKLLLFTESENIYRRSVLNIVYVFDIATGSIVKLEKEKVLHATFSPDGQQITYVQNNNIYIKEIATNKVTAITSDGIKNKIINGNCDWVYEEEFGFSNAMEWSADGNYLAYYRFDETNVPEYSFTKYSGLYPTQYTYKYPKAGEKNSVVAIRIFDVRNKTVTNVALGKEEDQYIPRIKWTNNAKELCVYRLNRHQNKLELLLADAGAGATKVIYSEENKCYIDINDEITFLPDGHSMILRSEKDGFSHLYNYDWISQKMQDLTAGNFDVDNLVGVDKNKKLLFYTAAENSPLQRNLYETDWAGKHKKCLTPERGYHSITPCEGNNYFLDRFSEINRVPVYYLRDSKGKIVKTLEDNSELESRMKEYNLGDVKIMPVITDKDTLNGWMIFPPQFDSTKKYPVLMYQYSGPGSQEVADRFPLGNYFWHQMLAEKGYIVACVDGRGTGFRGEAFKKVTYLQLGKYESDDQVAAARTLGKLPFVDKDRIGIWGWSFGGFMSSTCVFKGNDVFKMAIAVAPVTNWRYYDNIYTERFMRTPAENEKGYDDNAPEKIADKLKGKFLLIHGTADDNVHLQNSIMLTNNLISAGKEFDSEYYPNKNHSITGAATRFHLYKRMTDFILKNL